MTLATRVRASVASAAALLVVAGASMANAAQDIVDTAVAAGQFKTLVAAVKAAGLEQTLRGPGPFTVFAPTDDAFAKLPKGTVEDLLKPENKAKLTAILTYHVVPGAVPASKVTGQPQTLKTVQGSGLEIERMVGTMPDSVFLNDGSSKVIKADISASNGVIHVIDTVVLPKS
jgi:uncharacterized surface protein with fasciclin (FAS1) repeats